jgi:hypothetical protein
MDLPEVPEVPVACRLVWRCTPVKKALKERRLEKVRLLSIGGGHHQTGIAYTCLYSFLY